MSDVVACICEGSAETAIMEILLENNMLIFTYRDVIDTTRPLLSKRFRCAKIFEKELLTKDFGGRQISVFYIHDSPNEAFKLSKKYQSLIKYKSCVTRPEIEMLFIISMGKYAEYKKKYHKIKPSDYVKRILGVSNVKNYEFIKDHFKNLKLLLQALMYYKSHSSSANFSTIADLLDMNHVQDFLST